MDDLLSNGSDEDSDFGPAIFSNNTPASSRKVCAVRVGTAWNAAVLGTADEVPVIFGTTPTSSQKVGAAAASYVDAYDSDNKEVAANAAVAVASTATGTASTRYKWPKDKDIFTGAPDDKLSEIVKHAIVETPWKAKLSTKA